MGMLYTGYGDTAYCDTGCWDPDPRQIPILRLRDPGVANLHWTFKPVVALAKVGTLMKVDRRASLPALLPDKEPR